MNLRLFLITALCSSSLTQAIGQFPFPAPHGTTIFSSLLEPPCVVEVSEVSGNAASFSLRLIREGNVTSTYTRSSNIQNAESEFVAHLKAGQRYRFPQCAIDLLGLEKTLGIVRTLPGEPLEELDRERLFRAVVLDQGIGEINYSIILQEDGGRLRHLQGSLKDPRIQKVAMALSRGRSYEFPAILEDALLSKEDRLAKSKPITPETAVLQRYLGVWRGHLDDHPEAKVGMICHPRADGSGIWREITFDDGSNDVPPLPDIAIVEYDRLEKSYPAITMPSGSVPPLHSTWDEKTLTFTTELPADDRGRRRVNTATFTREDRIDWKTITQSQKGELLSTSSGHYERLRPLDHDEGEPLPPTPYTGNITTPFPLLAAPRLPDITPPYPVTLAGLSSSPPFRARIAVLSVTDDSITLQLLHNNGHYKSLIENRSGIGNSDLGKALSFLKKGETYEFPYCIEHPGQSEANKPSTSEMKALEPFIGKWSGRVLDESGNLGPTTPATTRYFWSADGKALWREFYSPGGGTTVVNGQTVQLQERTSLIRITYNPATRDYVEMEECAEASPMGIRAAWDAGKQAYTWKGVMGPLPEIKGTGTRTFSTPDLIEWQSRQLKMDGTLIKESSGIYERIKP